jgi:hypothetical protein
MNRNMRKYIVLLFLIFFFACKKESNEIYLQSLSLNQNYELWKSKNITEYIIEESVNCECINVGTRFIIKVKDNQIIEIKNKETGEALSTEYWGQFKTIEQIFQYLLSLNLNQLAGFYAEYNEQFGYPKCFFIDFNKEMIDEELGYTVTLLK